MSIQVHCLGCDGRTIAPESMAGKTGRCPKCGARVTFPGVATPTEPLAGVSSPVAVATVPSRPASALRRAPSRAPLARGADAGPRSPHRSWVAVGALGVVVVVAGVALFYYTRRSGHGSPEEVLRTADTAIREKDYRTFYHCTRPADRGLLVASAMMGAALTAAFQDGLKSEGGAASAEVEEAFKKHGLTKESAMAAAQKLAEPDKAAAGPELKDPEGLFVDLFTLMSKGKDNGGMKFNLGPEMKNVVVEGEKAHGEVTADGKTQSVLFAREDGMWYLAVKP